MTDRQNNSINMIDNVDNNALQPYKTVWQSRKPFAAAAAVIARVRIDLQDPMIKRGKDTTGTTEDRDAVLHNAAIKADYIGDIIQAYALDQHDNDLYRTMMFSYSDLERMSVPEAHAKMMEVHAKGTGLFTALSDDYGLEQDDLDELKADADMVDLKKGGNRAAVGEKKEAGKNIVTLISQATAALHKMDKTIATFAKASPEFVAAYRNARIIVDSGHGKKGQTP